MEGSEVLSTLQAELAGLSPNELKRGAALIFRHVSKLFAPAHCWLLVGCKDGSSSLGWSPLAAMYAGSTTKERDVAEAWFAEKDLGALPEIQQTMAGVGTLRAVRPRAGMSAAAWKASRILADLRSLGRCDQLIGAHPVGEHAEVYLGVDRREYGEEFTVADERALLPVLRSLSWYFRWLVLSYGLLHGPTPLSPRKREALGHLLTGAGEKEIAYALGIRQSYAHQLIVQIYRAYHVNSRAELMALWLSDDSHDQDTGVSVGTSYP